MREVALWDGTTGIEVCCMHVKVYVDYRGLGHMACSSVGHKKTLEDFDRQKLKKSRRRHKR